MKSRKLFFIGICGTAMGNVALMMRDQGWEVSGSDSRVYPPMSTVLSEAGISLWEGYSEENLIRMNPDLVVVGNAVGRGNPEVEYLLEHRHIERVSLPELLSDELLRHRRTLVVAGTHGKTTTTSLAAALLEREGENPGYLIGGVPQDLSSGWNPGVEEGYFIIEGDEYDTAFFDKRSKFIHYRPQGIILNNLEFDHADIFRDLPDIERSFRHLLRILPNSGFVVTNGDDPVLEGLFPIEWGDVIRVGVGERNDLRICDFTEESGGVCFRLNWRGEQSPEIRWKLPGLYNVRNVAMAWAGTRLLKGTSPAYSPEIHRIEQFHGVKRRQDFLGEKENWIFLEDFGHHPTALRLALESFRNRYPDRSLYAMLEPRSNTLRTKIFQQELTESLKLADYVGLAPVHRAVLLESHDRLNIGQLAESLCFLNVKAQAFESYEVMEATLKSLIQTEKNPALMVFFSNGAFDSLPGRIIGSLSTE